MKAPVHDPVRFGLVGCGELAYWTHLHLLRSLPSTRLVAICDPDEAALRRAQQRVNAEVYRDVADLLTRGDVDAVLISAPSHLHARLAVQSAAAGKHVYIEKPLAINARGARWVGESIRSAGVSAAVGFNYRYHPLVAKSRDLLRSGRLGRITEIRTEFCEPSAVGEMSAWRTRRRTGGGVLLDLGSHHFDLLRWLLDDEAVEVSAQLTSCKSADDEAKVSLTMASGTLATSVFSFRGEVRNRFELRGENGLLLFDRHRAHLELRVRGKGRSWRRQWIAPSAETLRLWIGRLIRPTFEPSYRSLLSSFADHIAGGSGEVPSIADGAESLAIVLAAEAAARQGAPTRIDVWREQCGCC